VPPDANGGSWGLDGPSRGIGRGLGAILANSQRELEGLRELQVDLIRPNPRQPRRRFDREALTALSESIKARGVLQPIVVRPLEGGTSYELVAGERRLRAAKMADMRSVPAVVRDTDDDEQLELALVENVAREDLNPVEEARACAALVEDLGMTKEELARRIGRSRAAVSNLIRLLDLPDEALALIESGELSEGHGRALLGEKDESRRRELARRAAAQGWTVRQTERHAKPNDRRGPPPEGTGSELASGTIHIHPDLADALGSAEDALTAALGREVRLRSTGGRVRAEFELEDPRDGIALAERLLSRPAA